jgi:hypothetical protein
MVAFPRLELMLARRGRAGKPAGRPQPGTRAGAEAGRTAASRTRPARRSNPQPVRITEEELAWLSRLGADIRAVFHGSATAREGFRGRGPPQDRSMNSRSDGLGFRGVRRECHSKAGRCPRYLWQGPPEVQAQVSANVPSGRRRTALSPVLFHTYQLRPEYRWRVVLGRLARADLRRRLRPQPGPGSPEPHSRAGRVRSGRGCPRRGRVVDAFIDSARGR